jgi:hypothetical protein
MCESERESSAILEAFEQSETKLVLNQVAGLGIWIGLNWTGLD